MRTDRRNLTASGYGPREGILHETTCPAAKPPKAPAPGATCLGTVAGSASRESVLGGAIASPVRVGTLVPGSAERLLWTRSRGRMSPRHRRLRGPNGLWLTHCQN